MKKLTQFLEFKSGAFFAEKRLQVVGLSDWSDFKTKQKLGVKVDVAIVEDRTQYDTKPGEVVSNKFEKIAVKVKKDAVAAKPDDIVELVNPVCKVYGDYQNQLSVTCNDLRVLELPKKA